MPPPQAPIPGAAPAAPPVATARLSDSSRTLPAPLTRAGSGARPRGTPSPEAAPSPPRPSTASLEPPTVIVASSSSSPSTPRSTTGLYYETDTAAGAPIDYAVDDPSFLPEQPDDGV
ncbi:proline-rich receptor-like protein kinase PERK2 [Triticum urartu]|uniref:proline-rich receptor-like protein kinase PERK2 n=1 Tax=Triticum urartu TaxID=4572 RepID=UPI0020437DDF|nr:proline-rich receptor-like protein kinase PERK2 [Triticum urartu]